MRLGGDIDATCSGFDGHKRAAIRSLLIADEFLISDVDRLRAVVVSRLWSSEQGKVAG
jgi:hypothetical protein